MESSKADHAGRLCERHEGGSALEKALVRRDRSPGKGRCPPDPLHRLRFEVGRVGSLAQDPRAEVVTLLVTQRVDWIEPRRFPRGIKPKKDSDTSADHERENDRPGRDER